MSKHQEYISRYGSWMVMTATGLAGLPDVQPRDLRWAARRGRALMFAGEGIDLESIKDWLPRLRGLIAHEGATVRSTHLLERASSLELLHVASTDGEADVSRLQKLRDVAVGYSLRSALRSPRIKRLTYFDQSRSSPKAFSALESLTISSQSFSVLDSIEHPDKIKSLGVTATDLIDLHGVSKLRNLRELRIQDAKLVTGVAEIPRLTHLESLSFSRVTTVDSTDWLLEVRIQRLAVLSNTFVTGSILHDLQSRVPYLDVDPRLAEGGGKEEASPFQLSVVGAYSDLSTDRFAWFESRASALGYAVAFDGYSLQELVARTLPIPRSVQLDSEASWFHAVSDSRLDLEALSAEILMLWSDDSRLLQALEDFRP